ncbi:MAG TPA: DegT/DnrJ/EryC1/StrS family aminotransferase [Thermoanaerobaculia bacterium]|nr:DegT/DnrJ/EryC1/StrS family aminotransferase [Thermoanaerobaculia bacterium]
MKVPSESVPFVGLAAQAERLRTRMNAALGAVLDHRQYVMGPEIPVLEQRLAERGGVAEAVAVASGTDALVMTLMAEGIGPGDAVLVPSFTFTATAEVVLLVGAIPVFLDVDERSFNVDVTSFEGTLAEIRRQRRLEPRALIAVDLFGRPANYEELGEIAAREGLLIVDDAAQGFGGALHGRPVGSLAAVTTTSFFPAKPLGGYGDGGAILTDDVERAQRLRSIRQHGEGADRYEIVRLGVNGRLDTFQAAVLLVKLEVFDEELEARDRLAALYHARLADVVACPEIPPGVRSAWAQYTIQVEQRDRVRAALAAEGVPTAVYYPKPMHLQPAYQRYGGGPGSLPTSERLCERVLSLPMHPYLEPEQIERVCDAVRRAVT